MQSSRTIESVKFLNKILFYDIRIENIEYHLFDRTITTNKWLRFEDWQQIYEKLKSALLHCTLLDLSEFSESSFLISNNIQVEIAVTPMECFYDELFALEAHCCAPNLLQITIRQLNAIKLKARIAELERSNEKRLRKKQSKLNDKGKTAEYNPVLSMRNLRGEYVPLPNVSPYTPYKASKFTNDRPDTKDYEEPYSPKPVTATSSDDIPIELDSSMEKYSPIIPSNSDSTPTEIPKYKPSAIVISESSDQSSPRLRSNRQASSSNKLSITKKSKNALFDKNDTKNIANQPIKEVNEQDAPTGNIDEDDDTELQSTAETLVPLQQKRKRKSSISQRSKSDEREKHHLSQDLFEESESKSDDSYHPSDRKRSKSSNRKTKPSSSNCSKSKKAGSYSKKATGSSSKNQLSSKQSPTRTSKLSEHQSKSQSKNDDGPQKERNRKKAKTTARSKSKTPDPVPNSIVIPQFTKPTDEELRKEREQQAKNIAELETFNKQLKEMNKPTPNVDIIHLNNINVEDLLGTFDDVKPMLDKYFNKHKSQTRYEIKSENDKLYLLIAKIINRDNLMPMIEHLQSVYEPDSDGVPSYTDLFMNLMLPEWVLFIFMKEYNLNRHDAIERIKIQEFEGDDSNETLT